MSKIENAVNWIIKIANDNSHGYDQLFRWNEKGDYDCSSLVISAWVQAGVNVKANGATYTGNMYRAFRASGFEDVTSKVNLSTGAGMQAGDVLLNVKSHTAMYIGNGKICHAAGNEKGGATGGTPGDQTGNEICLRAYYNSPWDYVLRFSEGNGTTLTTTDTSIPTLKYGCLGENVKALQTLLLLRGQNIGGCGVDGDYGLSTNAAVISYQKLKNIEVDGVCGPQTWGALING